MSDKNEDGGQPKRVARGAELEKLLQAIQPSEAMGRQIAEMAASFLSGTKRSIERANAEIREALASHAASFAAAFQEMQKSWRDLTPALGECVLSLGEAGWYLDMEMSIPELRRIKEALDTGRGLAVDEWLADHFGGRLDGIERDLSAALPARAKVLQAAFAAHRREEFELSVPVLLIQTDGICVELAGGHLFMTNRSTGLPQTSLYVESIASDTLMAALLRPLASKLPIAASAPQRAPGWTQLNRHTVLHGESLDYGTRINSAKAVSLVNYAGSALKKSRGSPA